MVLSAVGPMAAPVGAEHESDDWPWLSLEIFNDGSWTNVDHEYEESPFNVSVEAGTHLMHLSANNLELNTTYNMTWTVSHIEGGTWEESNSTTHTREWFSYTNTSGESWNLTIDDGTCYAHVEAQLETVEADGSRDHVTGFGFMIWGPCGFNGIVGLSAEIGGSWVDLAAQDSDLVLTEGTYDLQWNFANLSANSTYRFQYLFESMDDVSEGEVEDEHHWTGANTSHFDSWSLDIESWYCEMVIDGWLWETFNGSEDQLLGGFAIFPSGECEEPPQHFELWVDGSLYSNTHYLTFDECTEFSEHDYECWNDDWDEDGDGNPDWTEWQHHCVNWFDDVAGTDWWECETWESPRIEEGTHSMVLNVTELDNDTEYMVHVDVDQYFNHQGAQHDDYEFAINTTGMTGEPIFDHFAFSVMTQNNTCNLHVQAQIFESEYGDGSYHYLDSVEFYFHGPCEEPESPFTLTYDGIEWEEEWFYDNYDHCNIEDGWEHHECWNDDWDFDSDGMPEMWDHRYDCELFTDETTTESWWGCPAWSEYPTLEAGNHSMTLLVEDLDENSSYYLDINLEVCNNMMGCEGDEGTESFNTSAQQTNYTASGWLETDEFTCEVWISAHLFEIETETMGNTTSTHHQALYWDDWRFRGPCEEPESPFTVAVDGVVHEDLVWYTDYDHCEPGPQGHFECWNDDWDEDGDGNPDWTDYRHDCDEVNDETTGESWWQCLDGMDNPSIGPGNHEFNVTVEDLEVGDSYVVMANIHDNQAGWNWDSSHWDDQIFINASSASESFSFWFETDNQTCGVHLGLNLYEVEWHTDNSSNDTWYHIEGGLFFDQLNWRGPCEMPPSPFTLYADGVEHEMIQFYDNYDQCHTEDGWDHHECWFDDWDEDGDGDPDWTDYRHDCELFTDETTSESWWGCPGHSEPPLISEGNHSMQLDMDVESGESYVLNLNIYAHGWMNHHSSHEEILFNSTSDLESHFFSIITDDSTCNIQMSVDLHTVKWEQDSWHHEEPRGYDHFDYNGPCEEPDHLDLWYEDEGGNLTIWESTPSYRNYENCHTEDWWDHFECWYDEWDYDNDGQPEEWDWQQECDPMADGTWECADGFEDPEIEAGNYTMTFVAKDLEEGESYQLVWAVWAESPFSSFEEEEQSLDFTAQDIDGDGLTDEYQATWSMTVEPDWCHIGINGMLFVTVDHDGDGVADDQWDISHEWFHFQAPCEIDLPVDIGLDHYDDGIADWVGVELVPNDWLFDEPEIEGCDEEYHEDVCVILAGTGYDFQYPGEQLMRWSMDGLTVGQEYTLMTDVDSYDEDDGGEDDWYWCHDGNYDIEFHRVNDGYEDCEDGSDEPSYDDDGTENSWFQCWDGTTIPLSSVNDGYEDCPDGSDEGDSGTTLTMINASAETEYIEWDYEVSDDTCYDILIAQLMIPGESEESEEIVGIGLAIIAGPASVQDDNGDGIPDCLMWHDDDGPDEPSGINWGSQNDNLGFLFTDGSGDPFAVEAPWPYMQLQEGQHNVRFEVFLGSQDPGTNVTLAYAIDAQGWMLMEGEMTLETNSDGHAISDDHLLEIGEWDCFLLVSVSVFYTDTGDWIDDYNMMLEGPCHGGSGAGLITVDAIDDYGNSWGDPSDGGTYDECIDHQGFYECWNEDWDEDGDGEPDWTAEHHHCGNWFDDASGSDWWECQSFLDQGMYSFEFYVTGLEPNQEYDITGGAYDGMHDVEVVVEMLFATEQPPQLETTVVADSNGEAQVTLWGEFHHQCRAFVYLESMSVPADDTSDAEVHDTYYAFFNTPCGDGGGGQGPEWGSQNGQLAFVFTDGGADPAMHMEAWPFMQLEPDSYIVGIHANTELIQTDVTIRLEIEGQGGNIIADSVSDLTTDDYGHAFDDTMITINGWDCFVHVHIEMLDQNSGDLIDYYEMMLEGPCQGGSGNGFIAVEAFDDYGNSWGDPNQASLEDGDWEFGIEISSMTEGTEYMVSAGVYDNVYGVKDVVNQLWDTPPQLETTIVADSSGTEGISISSPLGESCSGFIFVEVWYMTDTDDGEENHDTYYAFFQLPGCEGDGGDDMAFDPSDFAIGENYHAVFWGEYNGYLEFTVGSVMPLDVSIRDKIDHDFGNADGVTTWEEADMFMQAFFMMMDSNSPMNFMYPCADGENLAPLVTFNDGYADCPDGSDEPSYDDDGTENSWFHCWDEDETMILVSKVNNGVVDCPNGIDEPAMMGGGGPQGLESGGLGPLEIGTQEVWFDGLTSDSTVQPSMITEWFMVFEDTTPGDGTYEMSFVGDEALGDDDSGDDDDGSSYVSEVCGETGGSVTHIYDITSAVVNGTEIATSQPRTCFEVQSSEPMPPFTITWSLNETADTDGDGEPDDTDDFPFDPTETRDTDGDGWGDNSDAFPNDPTEWVDTDGDGVGDNADLDADGDGVNDDSEDSDGDGVNDDLDAFPFDANETTDTDGDGVGDNSDAFPNDANETTDTDGDGIGDNSDDDADGDGTPNGLDDFPLNSAESTDTDGDGVGDSTDAFPTDPNEWADADGDLIGDNADDDDDNDGVKDVNDAFPFDASEDTDSDSDGVGDNADAFPNDPYERKDSDGDGVGDNADDFPSDPSEWADSDGDGVGNNQDAFDDDPDEIADTDEDGVGNNADQCPSEKEDSNDGDGCPETSSADTEPADDDDGGLLPGFSAALGMISLLGAASLASGRRKD